MALLALILAVPSAASAQTDPRVTISALRDQSNAAIAAQDPKVIPAFAAAVPSPIGTIPIGLCQFDFGEFGHGFYGRSRGRRSKERLETLHL